MDVLEAFNGLRQHIEQFAASAKEKLEEELPVLGSFAQDAATNPILAAWARAEHLPQVPEYAQMIADEITKADEILGAAKAKAAADATAAAQQPPAEAPAAPAQPTA